MRRCLQYVSMPTHESKYGKGGLGYQNHLLFGALRMISLKSLQETCINQYLIFPWHLRTPFGSGYRVVFLFWF